MFTLYTEHNTIHTDVPVNHNNYDIAKISIKSRLYKGSAILGCHYRWLYRESDLLGCHYRWLYSESDLLGCYYGNGVFYQAFHQIVMLIDIVYYIYHIYIKVISTVMDKGRRLITVLLSSCVYHVFIFYRCTVV